MKNKPGISWGASQHVNLVEVHPGDHHAVYYDDEYSDGEVIATFSPASCAEYFEMTMTVTLWNYNTCKLCEEVRAELSWQD